jgi:uncharacterized protein
VIPTFQQRLVAREKPSQPVVMLQRWSDLLFLHWKWDIAELQKKLPKGLFVDTFDGEAWLGIVPFMMEKLRPRFLPAIPGLSWFRELNVRTYVYDEKGNPGVWFFSLDCDQAFAVFIAQQLFHLPYENAKMDFTKNSGQLISYECHRKNQTEVARYRYQLNDEKLLPEIGSLDFFLLERYRLFSEKNQQIYSGRVYHEPYQTCEVSLQQWSGDPFIWDGFNSPNRSPDHIAASHCVDVSVYPLMKNR